MSAEGPTPVILKLGGSAITIKNRPLTLDKRAINRLAGEIKQADMDSLVIVHGGGSFGHWVAEKYDITDGYKEESQILGFSKTHQAMTLLNKQVVDSLISRSIPAVAISPASMIATKSGRINIMEERPLRNLLELGFTPVLYGDAVSDTQTGFNILSGDQLVVQLAIRLDAERILIGADVDGLYDADPKTSQSARLISHITLPQLMKLQEEIAKPSTMDVTGGMFGKVLELLPVLDLGVQVIIANAREPGTIYKALKGETVGTLIEKGEQTETLY
ncbi:MAG: isopentenyl phosphate kinase family protein [Candidatus Bathyarchaeota archaeon]|nr:MAG: isopentenyl phosphate kinase family protein [Candidatus Bathyarchaeota archaeon]